MIQADYDDAKNLYENGISDFSFPQLVLLCRYLFWELNYKDTRIISYLRKLMPENVSEIISEAKIKNAIKGAKYKKLLKNKAFVGVSPNELEKLKEIKSRKYRMLLLTMLVNSKATSEIYPLFDYDKNGLCFHGSIRTALELSGIKMTKKEINEFIVSCREYIQAFPHTIYLWKILFSDSENVDIIRIYPESSLCSKCNSVIEKLTNRMDYCPSCAMQIEREKTKERVKRFRERKKNNVTLYGAETFNE